MWTWRSATLSLLFLNGKAKLEGEQVFSVLKY